MLFPWFQFCILIFKTLLKYFGSEVFVYIVLYTIHSFVFLPSFALSINVYLTVVSVYIDKILYFKIFFGF